MSNKPHPKAVVNAVIDVLMCIFYVVSVALAFALSVEFCLRGMPVEATAWGLGGIMAAVLGLFVWMSRA